MMTARTRTVRRLGVALTALALLGGTTACGDSSSEADAATPATEAAPATGATTSTALVGDLAGSTTKLALYVEGDKVWGYLCDPDAAAIALTGTVDAGALNLAEPDGTTTVTGTLADGTFTGKVLLGGTTSHDVSAVTATGDAGAFIHYSATDTTTEIGAWIRDAEGEAVGNITVISNDPSAGDGSVTVTEGTGGVSSDAVPFALGDRFRCFTAARVVVKANQQPGGASQEQISAMNRACLKAFPVV